MYNIIYTTSEQSLLHSLYLCFPTRPTRNSTDRLCKTARHAARTRARRRAYARASASTVASATCLSVVSILRAGSSSYHAALHIRGSVRQLLDTGLSLTNSCTVLLSFGSHSISVCSLSKASKLTIVVTVCSLLVEPARCSGSLAGQTLQRD